MCLLVQETPQWQAEKALEKELLVSYLGGILQITVCDH